MRPKALSSEEHQQNIYERVYKRKFDEFLDRYLNGDDRYLNFEGRAEEAAKKAVTRGTTESWDSIRWRIWDRDGPTCHVCGDEIPVEHYECGHIVDRVCGGTDLDDNLVVMCVICNRVFKPLHETKEAYEEWRAQFRRGGGYLGELRRFAS